MATTTASSSRPHKRTKMTNSNTPAERRASYRLDMMEDMTSKMVEMRNQTSQNAASPPESQASNPWSGNNYDLDKLLDSAATPSAFLPDTTSSHYGFPTQQLYQQQGATDQFIMGDFMKTGLTPFEDSKQPSHFDQSMWGMSDILEHHFGQNLD